MVYVNYGQISNQQASYLIGWVVDHMPRIYYTGYYDHKSGSFMLYPRNVACPGSYAPELYQKRRVYASDIKPAR